MSTAHIDNSKNNYYKDENCINNSNNNGINGNNVMMNIVDDNDVRGNK